MFWEESGSPTGRPVLYLHGGPGGGSSPAVRRIFNPERYRLIMYDQRGCGRSTPNADVSRNDLNLLLLDIEALRLHLGITRWLLCGSSWGATLACEYSKRNPACVEGVLLYGAFVGRVADIEYFVMGGRGRSERVWRAFADHVSSQEASTIVERYWGLVSSSSPRAVAAALSWAQYEIAMSQYPAQLPSTLSINRRSAFALAKISAHYFRHQCFLPDDGVLPGLSLLADIPAIIVHGTEDAVCSITAAYELSRAWPNSRVEVIEAAGHVPNSATYWSKLSSGLDTIERGS